MKRVSFKVAKAIKEAGYPQVCNSPCYITEDCTKKYDADYDGDMPIIEKEEYNEGQYIDIFGYIDEECNPPRCYAPTYIDVWLWLWKKKNLYIDIVSYNSCVVVSVWGKNTEKISENIEYYSDPEEAITEAIEYLVNNDSIK